MLSKLDKALAWFLETFFGNLLYYGIEEKVKKNMELEEKAIGISVNANKAGVDLTVDEIYQTLKNREQD